MKEIKSPLDTEIDPQLLLEKGNKETNEQLETLKTQKIRMVEQDQLKME